MNLCVSICALNNYQPSMQKTYIHIMCSGPVSTDKFGSLSKVLAAIPPDPSGTSIFDGSRARTTTLFPFFKAFLIARKGIINIILEYWLCGVPDRRILSQSSLCHQRRRLCSYKGELFGHSVRCIRWEGKSELDTYSTSSKTYIQ